MRGGQIKIYIIIVSIKLKDDKTTISLPRSRKRNETRILKACSREGLFGIVLKDIRLRFRGTLSSPSINPGLAQKQSAPAVILITARPFVRRGRVARNPNGRHSAGKEDEERSGRSGRNEVDRDKYGKEGLKQMAISAALSDPVSICLKISLTRHFGIQRTDSTNSGD